ncbi:MAG: tetratricopeptide repeat protein, partial [Myxococcota bacterium]|nr:tetratricopeptide repeat protein [Myxococcota bacterium]
MSFDRALYMHPMRIAQKTSPGRLQSTTATTAATKEQVMRHGSFQLLSPRAIARALIIAALPLMLTACESDEEKLAAFYAQGEDYAEQEKFQEAVIEYKNVLKINPNHADTHYELAKAYMNLGRARDAYWEMSETVRLDPSNTEAGLSFGALSLVANDGEQALAMGDLAIKNEPENPQGYILRGKALQLLKREGEAEEFYLKAVEIDGGLDNLATIASYYASLPDGRQKAEPWFWKAIEQFPRNFRAHSLLARFLMQDPAREAEAEDMFKAALATSPAEGDKREEGYANLARFYLDRNRTEDGEAILREGVEAMPASTLLRFMLATYYRVEGNYEESEKILRAVTEIDPQDPAPFLVLSSFMGGQDNLEEALAAADSALAIAPDNVEARLRRAEILVDVGFRAASAESASGGGTLAELSDNSPEITEGLQIVEAILAETPFHPQAEFVRGKAYLAKADSQKGIEAFGAAVEGRPDWAQAHFALGSARVSIGEASRARVSVARALELDPGMHQARRVLATIHQTLGEHEYSIEQANRYLQINPDDSEMRVLIAQSLIKLGRREAALKELNKVPADQRDAGVEFALGRVLANLGQPAEARGHLLRVLDTSPHNHKVLRTLFRLDRGNESTYPQTRDLIVAASTEQPNEANLIQLLGMVQFT